MAKKEKKEQKAKPSEKKEEKKAIEEEAEALTEEVESAPVLQGEEGLEEEEEEKGIELPFPKATIVNMLRQYLDPGKQIKGQVKMEMNLWLGKMVERIAKKMNSHPYTYVDGSMFWEAIESYENITEIELEKERIIKELEAVKAACDVLVSEVDRKFTLRKSFAHKYLAEGKKEEEKK